MNSYIGAFRKYAVFSGRTTRRDYWTFVLINNAALSVMFIVASLLGGMAQSAAWIVTVLYAFGTLLPSISVAVRRLHDTGRRGWWYLLTLIPLGSLVVLVWFLQPSDPGENKYGPDAGLALPSA